MDRASASDLVEVDAAGANVALEDQAPFEPLATQRGGSEHPEAQGTRDAERCPARRRRAADHIDVKPHDSELSGARLDAAAVLGDPPRLDLAPTTSATADHVPTITPLDLAPTTSATTDHVPTITPLDLAHDHHRHHRPRPHNHPARPRPRPPPPPPTPSPQSPRSTSPPTAYHLPPPPTRPRPPIPSHDHPPST
jgi:hypothetical protein